MSTQQQPQQQASTKVIVPPSLDIKNLVRFSYCNVFTPKAMKPGQEPKYSVSILIPKNNKKLYAMFVAAATEAKNIGLVDKWKGKWTSNHKWPIRDGDVDRPDDEAYAGHWFVNASCKTKPAVVGRNPKIAIIDSTEFFSGCYGTVSVNFYPYNVDGGQGVACGLNNIQKIHDGKPLGGRANAEDEFTELPEEDSNDDSFMD